MSDVSLSDAIASAHAELNAEIAAKGNPLAPAATAPPETPAEESPEIEIENPAEEEPAETDAAEADELSAEQLAEARNVYKALRDPKTAAPLIAALAQQSGLLTKLGEAPTKTEVVAAQKEIEEILGEALGEYKFLAPKFGPAIKAILAQERESQQATILEIQQQNVTREVVAITEKLATETKGASKQYEARMSALANEIPVGDMNVNTYVRRLYAIASSERRPASQNVADKIRKNANDAPSRIRQGAQGRSAVAEMPNKKMSLDESIAWAAAQQGVQMKRK